MAKEKNLGSSFNKLFRFNEKDWIAGFYKGTTTMKFGEAILISNLEGDKVVGVPNYTVLKDIPNKAEVGDFILLQYKGQATSKNTGEEYMDIKSRAWELETEEEIKDYNENKCNVTEILEALPDYEPDKEAGSKAGEEIEDEDLPF